MECLTKIKTFELTPCIDTRKSFYGKALIIKDGDKITLKSYNTIVACIENGVAKVFGHYSQTTSRHIKEFLYQNDFKAENTKQILNDYYQES